MPSRWGIYLRREKTALLAVPGQGKKRSTHFSSKEQRPRSGLFFFQSGHTSKT